MNWEEHEDCEDFEEDKVEECSECRKDLPSAYFRTEHGRILCDGCNYVESLRNNF